MKNLISWCLILGTAFPLFTHAQKGYKVEIQVKGLKDSLAFMSYYYGKGQYYRDTAIVGEKGKMIFEGEDSLEHGMYSFIANNARVFDFMVDGQEFQLATDTVNVVANMKVENSPENDRFYEYMRFLNTKQKEARKLEKEKKEANEKQKEGIQEKMLALDDEVRAFIKDFHKRYPGSFTSNFIYALEYPTVPDPPKDENGNEDSTFAFRYFKQHFFDNYNFEDQRLLRTTTYHEKLMYYMEKLTLQDPDSVIISADYVLSKALQNKVLFQYTLSTLTSKYERSQQMGMDAVFVHLAKNYFMKGMAKEWFTDDQLKKLAERANALDPLLIGKKAPNIVVKDTSQKKFLQLYDINAKYTVVYIWSPECGHCKKATPKLKILYDKYKDQGVEVFGVGNEFENEEWIKFIDKHKLDWINGSDGGDFRSNFRTLYDVYSTPQTYLLDQDKKILSKKMDIDSLEKILEHLYKEEKEKKLKEEAEKVLMNGK